MPTDIINTLDNLTATLGHLSAEFDQVEKDIELLRQFGGSRDDFQQFSTSLRDQLRALERLSEQLSVELEDHYYDSDSQRQELQETLGKLDKRKVTLQRSFRSALLQYRINSTNSAKKERELLLSGATTPMELRKRKAKTGNAVVNTASEVTAALKDTVQLMNEEIEKSVKNITTLQDSSDRLKKTNEEHKTLESILRASKNLIKALEQADAVDRWLMLGGLLLFSLVVFNILRKRIPGVYTLFAVIRWVFFGSGGNKAADANLESRVSAAVASAAISVAATPLTSLASSSSPLIAEMPSSDVDSLSAGPSSTLDTFVSTASISDATYSASIDTTQEPTSPVEEHTESAITSTDHHTPKEPESEQQATLPDATPMEAAEASAAHEQDASTIVVAEEQATTSLANSTGLHEAKKPEPEQQPRQQQDEDLETTSTATEEPQQQQQQQQERPPIHFELPERRRYYTLPVERPVREEL